MPIKLQDYEPKTLEEAANLIYNNLDESEKFAILSAHSSYFHHGIGRNIRNEWNLWTDSSLKSHFKEVYGLGHADDMSGLILTSVKSLAHGLAYDVDTKNEVMKYKMHWRNQNIDPLTLKHIEDKS